MFQLTSRYVEFAMAGSAELVFVKPVKAPFLLEINAGPVSLHGNRYAVFKKPHLYPEHQLLCADSKQDEMSAQSRKGIGRYVYENQLVRCQLKCDKYDLAPRLSLAYLDA